MFGPFQNRLTTWLGRLKIDGGKLGGTAEQSALEITKDWNTTGNPTLIKANVTTGTAGSSAKLLDLQFTGVSRLSVDKDGNIQLSQYPLIKSYDITIKCSGSIYAIIGASQSGIGLGNSPNYPNAFHSLSDGRGTFIANRLGLSPFGAGSPYQLYDISLERESSYVLGQRYGTNAQESRIYATYTSATDYQRLSTKTIKEALTATAGATKTSTITIPAYSHLIGVTTRVTTALGTSNGTTGYQVGDGTDPDLWGAITGTAIGTTSDAANFTATDALGPSSAARTITLTAVGGNFDGTGVIEVCAFYQRVEAD